MEPNIYIYDLLIQLSVRMLTIFYFFISLGSSLLILNSNSFQTESTKTAALNVQQDIKSMKHHRPCVTHVFLASTTTKKDSSRVQIVPKAKQLMYLKEQFAMTAQSVGIKM